MTQQEGSLFAAIVGTAFDFGRSLGLTDKELLEAAGLRAEDFAQPDALLPFECVLGLWDLYVGRFPAMPLGLMMSQGANYHDMGIIGSLIMNSPTVGVSLDRLIRFNQLFDPLLEIQFERVGELCHLRLPHVHQLHAKGEPMEMIVSGICRRVRESAQQDRPLIAVHFAHARRHSDAVYEAAFGQAPLFFEQPCCALTFEAEILNISYPDADAYAGRYLERYADLLLKDLAPEETPATPSMQNQVRRALHEGLHQGHIGQEDIARSLAVSTRTLQRRLRQENTTFAALLDDVRRVHALHLLRDPNTTIYEIAYLLGYSEAASFHRAFRRWTGASPGDARPSN